MYHCNCYAIELRWMEGKLNPVTLFFSSYCKIFGSGYHTAKKSDRGIIFSLELACPSP